MSINDIIPSDEFILEVLGIGAIVLLVVLTYSYRAELLVFGRALFSRYVTMPTLDQIADMPVSPRPNAVKENAEIGKPAGPTPAELDRMLSDARAEAVARAVGTLAGAGLLAPNSRSKALLALGIEGRRYQLLKPVVDAAQTAAQSEAHARQSPPPVPPILVNEGRPNERIIAREESADPSMTSVAPPAP